MRFLPTKEEPAGTTCRQGELAQKVLALVEQADSTLGLLQELIKELRVVAYGRWRALEARPQNLADAEQQFWILKPKFTRSSGSLRDWRRENALGDQPPLLR